jgi:hypothetical protein
MVFFFCDSRRNGRLGKFIVITINVQLITKGIPLRININAPFTSEGEIPPSFSNQMRIPLRRHPIRKENSHPDVPCAAEFWEPKLLAAEYAAVQP